MIVKNKEGEMAEMEPQEALVRIDYVDGAITVEPERVECNQNPKKKDPKNPEQTLPVINQVRWEANEDNISDWRVIFGTYAPVDRKSKMADPDNKVLELVKRRPEDLGHWKYVVVALTKDGLKDKDPEMIVED